MVFEHSSRKLVWSALVGLLLAGAVAVGFELRPASIFPVNGTLVLEVADLPIEAAQGFACGKCEVTSLNVTVDSVRVHTSGALNLTSEWVEVLNSSQTFDIVKLTNTTQLLGSTSIPQTIITQIRLHITSAMAALSDTGQIIELTVPSGELKVNLGSLEVRAGMTTTVVIDFQPHVVCQGNGECKLTPVLGIKEVTGPQ